MSRFDKFSRGVVTLYLFAQVERSINAANQLTRESGFVSQRLISLA